jgi:hypothetical protein
MIIILKKQMQRSLEGKKYMYTHKRTCTLLKEAAQILNCRPIADGQWAEVDALCPADFLIERAVCCAPSMQPPQRLHIASVMKRCSGYVTCCSSYESTLYPTLNIPS